MKSASNFQKIRSKSSKYSTGDTDHFFEFMDFFRKQVANPHDTSRFKLKLDKAVPGASHLFHTFASSSQSSEKLEWNPFSQRVYMSAMPAEPPLLARDFELVTLTIGRFLEAFHEAAHILLWEPFFTGHYRPKNQTEFVDVSLAFEGFCFWLSDILTTPKIRAYLPDGEFVFSRKQISQKYFNPYRAFHALGFDDANQILDIYLDAFRGYKTPLLETSKDVFVNDLSLRVYGFYARSHAPLRLKYKRLKEAKIFSEFFKRFCQIPDLPSALPTQVDGSSVGNDPSQFCRDIMRFCFPYLGSLGDQELNRIRFRRHLQTRAYSSLSLSYALEHNLDFSVSGKLYGKSQLQKENKTYQDGLEELLISLSRGEDLVTLKANAQTLDKSYSRRIRGPLKEADVWIKRRGFYLPLAKLPGSEFGLIEEKKLSADQTKSIALHLADNFLTTHQSEKDLKIRQAFHAELARGEWKSRADVTRFGRAVDAMALSRPVLSKWSQALYETDPERNHFGELLFVFE